MKIQILGTGCAKCKTLHETVLRAVAETGAAVEVEKIEDIQRILSFDIVMTPGLAIDGEVKAAGRLPSLDEVKSLLAAAQGG